MTTSTMDAVELFFEELGSRGHEPRLEKAEGSLRFEVSEGKRTERWLVTVKKGDVEVSRRNASADLVLRAPRPLFGRLVRGRANAMAAVLRGELIIEGFAPELLVLFQRLLPRPKDARRMGRKAGYARRHK